MKTDGLCYASVYNGVQGTQLYFSNGAFIRRVDENGVVHKNGHFSEQYQKGECFCLAETKACRKM